MIRTSTLPAGVTTIIHTTDWRTIVLRRIQPLINDGTIDSERPLDAVIVIDCGKFVKLPAGGYETLARHFFPKSESVYMPMVVPTVVAAALASCSRQLTEAEARTLATARVPILFLCGDELMVFGLDELLGQPEARS
jgi:hypothetical protein